MAAIEGKMKKKMIRKMIGIVTRLELVQKLPKKQVFEILPQDL